MRFTYRLLIGIVLGILCGLSYDFIGPDAGTTVALGLSTAAIAITLVVEIFGIVAGEG